MHELARRTQPYVRRQDLGRTSRSRRRVPTWRGRVDDVRTGVRRYFTTLDDLVNYLSQSRAWSSDRQEPIPLSPRCDGTESQGPTCCVVDSSGLTRCRAAPRASAAAVPPPNRARSAGPARRAVPPRPAPAAGRRDVPHDLAERARDPFRGLYISEADVDELLAERPPPSWPSACWPRKSAPFPSGCAAGGPLRARPVRAGSAAGVPGARPRPALRAAVRLPAG